MFAITKEIHRYIFFTGHLIIRHDTISTVYLTREMSVATGFNLTEHERNFLRTHTQHMEIVTGPTT